MRAIKIVLSIAMLVIVPVAICGSLVFSYLSVPSREVVLSEPLTVLVKQSNPLSPYGEWRFMLTPDGRAYIEECGQVNPIRRPVNVGRRDIQHFREIVASGGYFRLSERYGRSIADGLTTDIEITVGRHMHHVEVLYLDPIASDDRTSQAARERQVIDDILDTILTWSGGLMTTKECIDSSVLNAQP